MTSKKGTNLDYVETCPKCGKDIAKVKGQSGLCGTCDNPAKETPHPIVPPTDPYGKVGKVSDNDPKGAPTYSDDAPVHGDKDVSNE